jgi:ADP-dependent NAD(P)H-hydrate dehydratase / NAD(P)H-hydrate epimerase
MDYVTRSLLSKSLPKREPWSRKGDFGRLLVVGGSRTYTGATSLAGLAALRSGCDLVKVVAPERAADSASSLSPDLIAEPLQGNRFVPLHARRVLDEAASFDALVIGNGMGKHPDTTTFVQTLIKRLDKPCVMDADAIRAVSLNPKLLGQSHVLTPHLGEFEILTGKRPGTNLQEMSSMVTDAAKSLGCTILLKGHVDVISDGRATLLNRTGTPFMTKAGTGDVLAGVCGAFLAMGVPPFMAASSAAYVNGLAGEAASKSLGAGLLASDVLGELPRTLIIKETNTTL